MDGILEKYNKISEWARWIICWPLIALVTILAGFLIQIVFSSTAWREGFEELSPDFYAPYSFGEFWMNGFIIVCQSTVFFFSIFYLVPRAQDIVAAIFAFFAVILNLLGMYGSIIGFINEDITLLQCVGGIILMCVGGGAAIYWTYQIRISVREGRELAFN